MKKTVLYISDKWNNLKQGDIVEMNQDWNKNGVFFWTIGKVEVKNDGDQNFDKKFVPDYSLYNSKYIFPHRMDEIRLPQ